MNLSAGIESFILSMTNVWSPATLKFYRNRLPSLVKFMGDVELESVTLVRLREWRAWLGEKKSKWGGGSSHPTTAGGFSPFTIHQYVRSAKRFFAWCLDEGLIDKDPARRLEKPYLPKRVPRGISTEDRDKLLAAARDDPRAKLIVLFLADTGCRVGGLAALLLEDIDLDGGKAVIREKGRGGWGKERPVFFGAETMEAIRDYLAIRPDIPGIDTLLVGWKRGINARWCSYGEAGIRLTLKRLAQQVKVKRGYNPHSFRHAAIRAWLDNGMPISEVAILAGHSTVAVTADVYGVVSESKLKADHSRYTWVGAARQSHA